MNAVKVVLKKRLRTRTMNKVLKNLGSNVWLINKNLAELEMIIYVREYYVGNKARGQISKRVFQENKERQIFRKNKHF